MEDDMIVIGGDSLQIDIPPEDAVFQPKQNKMNIVYLPQLINPFAYRDEDLPIVKSILEENEYNLSFIPDFNPKVIFDLGAHIGTASVYFANTYPNTQIYAVEPEINNFKMLTYNTVFHDNIQRIRAGIWNKQSKLKAVNHGFGLAGFMMEEVDDLIYEGNDIVDSVTIKQLLELANCDIIDVLKIDIEGSEKELFNGINTDEWLSKVRVLIIELHDRMKYGCSTSFFRAIANYEWFFTLSKENIVIVRNLA